MNIESLLGIAIGVIGLSLADFCDLTKSEWEACYHEWQTVQDAQYKNGWEMMRMQCAIMLNSKKKGRTIQPIDVLKFPWDGEGKKEVRRILTKEEEERELAEMKTKLGLK